MPGEALHQPKYTQRSSSGSSSLTRREHGHLPGLHLRSAAAAGGAELRRRPGPGCFALPGPSAAAAALLEGQAGVIRLQCYEGLDVSHAVYEWDYARQLLELRILEAAGDLDRSTARRELYSEAFLLKRPLVSLELPILALNRDLDNVAWRQTSDLR